MSWSNQHKKIRNLRDLRLEQARVKQAYQAIEENTINSLVSTDVIVSAITKAAFSNKRKKAANNLEKVKSNDRIKKQSKNKKSSKSYKKLGKSLLVWQGLSFLTFVGSQIYFYRKKRKKKA